jgi:hypothetical protein
VVPRPGVGGAGQHTRDRQLCLQPGELNTYRVKVDFSWQGMLPDDQRMASKTRHRWTVVDDPKGRFARIKTLAVDVLEPICPQP